MITSPDILWLGAHKTGTTFMQDMLARSRSALADSGILYLGLQAFRSSYTRPLLHSNIASYRSAGTLLSVSYGRGRYLIFDENILGLVQDAQAAHGLYPGGEERALHLARALGSRKLMLVLGIRKYSDFLPSLFCETIKAQPFLPFRIFQKTRFSALSWCDLAERLLAAFPEARLKIYTVEAMRDREAELLSWVCGNVSPSQWTVEAQSKARREGFSHDSMVLLHELAEARGIDNITATDLTNCLKAHPRDSQSRSFDPWTPSEKAVLDLKYRVDVNAIRALSRVDFWIPSA